MDYYCAQLLTVCLVADGKPRKLNTCDYSFVLFKANDYEHAFERAVALGKQQETQYSNAKGQPVRWAFVRVEAIKHLGAELDGIEVGSLLDVWRTEEPLPFSKRFQPHRSKPLFH